MGHSFNDFPLYPWRNEANFSPEAHRHATDKRAPAVEGIDYTAANAGAIGSLPEGFYHALFAAPFPPFDEESAYQPALRQTLFYEDGNPVPVAAEQCLHANLNLVSYGKTGGIEAVNQPKEKVRVYFPFIPLWNGDALERPFMSDEYPNDQSNAFGPRFRNQIPGRLIRAYYNPRTARWECDYHLKEHVGRIIEGPTLLPENGEDPDPVTNPMRRLFSCKVKMLDTQLYYDSQGVLTQGHLEAIWLHTPTHPEADIEIAPDATERKSVDGWYGAPVRLVANKYHNYTTPGIDAWGSPINRFDLADFNDEAWRVHSPWVAEPLCKRIEVDVRESLGFGETISTPKNRITVNPSWGAFAGDLIDRCTTDDPPESYSTHIPVVPQHEDQYNSGDICDATWTGSYYILEPKTHVSRVVKTVSALENSGCYEWECEYADDKFDDNGCPEAEEEPRRCVVRFYPNDVGVEPDKLYTGEWTGLRKDLPGYSGARVFNSPNTAGNSAGASHILVSATSTFEEDPDVSQFDWQNATNLIGTVTGAQLNTAVGQGKLNLTNPMNHSVLDLAQADCIVIVEYDSVSESYKGYINESEHVLKSTVASVAFDIGTGKLQYTSAKMSVPGSIDEQATDIFTALEIDALDYSGGDHFDRVSFMAIAPQPAPDQALCPVISAAFSNVAVLDHIYGEAGGVCAKEDVEDCQDP